MGGLPRTRFGFFTNHTVTKPFHSETHHFKEEQIQVGISKECSIFSQCPWHLRDFPLISGFPNEKQKSRRLKTHWPKLLEVKSTPANRLHSLRTQPSSSYDAIYIQGPCSWGSQLFSLLERTLCHWAVSGFTVKPFSFLPWQDAFSYTTNNSFFQTKLSFPKSHRIHPIHSVVSSCKFYELFKLFSSC